ncbi:MAG: rRNA adenine N-6-methyltransferase family protein, partial [Stappiaceae bacterium]
NPLKTGAVSPSGSALAKRMAQQIDMDRAGEVIELGPGTGVVTEAILNQGIARDRLTAIEFNNKFCSLLQRRFQGVNIVQGDAYSLKKTVSGVKPGSLASIVSSLPLFTSSVDVRRNLLLEAFELLQPGAPFIQFSYAHVPPVKSEPDLISYTKTGWVLLNLPPARVWIYRKPVPGISSQNS